MVSPSSETANTWSISSSPSVETGAPFEAGIDDTAALAVELLTIGVSNIDRHRIGVIAGALDGGHALVVADARIAPDEAPFAGKIDRLALGSGLPCRRVERVELGELARHLLGCDLPPIPVATERLVLGRRVLAEMEMGELAPLVLGAPLQRDPGVGVAARTHGAKLLGRRILENSRHPLEHYVTGGVPALLTQASTALVFIAGGWMAIEGRLTLGTLIAFAAYLGRVAGPVQTLLGLYVAAQRALVSLRRVVELTAERPAVAAPAVPRALPADGRGEVRFEGVRFGYRERCRAARRRPRGAAGREARHRRPLGCG